MKLLGKVKIGNKLVGKGCPTFIIAEIGINHNGSIDITKKLIDEAVNAGCDAVKFQKRTPELCVPEDQKYKLRDTPWGTITYIDYKKKIEFEEEEFNIINEYCKEKDILWFASCWDLPSVDMIEQFNPPAYKAASASLTDLDLLKKMKATGKPLIISTGMSTLDEIEMAVNALGKDNLLIAHSTSAYPCPVNELNLRMINTLGDMYPNVPIGYSGHETGLTTTVAATTLGATFIERHFTLDRAMGNRSSSINGTGRNATLSERY
ncbi:MAG: N-acetylneuraminate synthase family protein [Chitinophagales bacterium]